MSVNWRDAGDGLSVTDAPGDVCVVTFNRPDQRNGISMAMHDALESMCNEAGDDPAIGAIVLTGAGRAFSAGGNPKEFERMAGDLAYRRSVMRRGFRLAQALVNCPVPIVAAVNGPAVGMGCTIALLCDIVVMADTAFLQDSHVSLGLVAGDGGALVWPLMTSLLRAKEMLLLGDRVPADVALGMGLANRVVAPGELMDTALALARRLAGQPREAVQDTKRALNLHLAQAFPAVMSFGLAAEGESFISKRTDREVGR